ncbi:unnamed protein product [Strongylus vulgaris]|uniref:EGF-like domain-containing protein n=1 Tax=Strongylus vulgaris TaxID=40348 RepID=A0A3P7J2U4_STRVU|nr:unnamed protein product [Strongylus vulgaris]
MATFPNIHCLGKHDCSAHASCIDTADGFTCRCHDNYRDESPSPATFPGRVCIRGRLFFLEIKQFNQILFAAFVPDPPECEVSDPMSCDQRKEKYRVDCDENAICVDTDDSYTCQCRPGFADISAAFNRLPGRRCIEAVNECLSKELNDCSEFAFCEDAKEGYVCSCRPGYVDASPNATHYPGRVCRKPVEKFTMSEFTSSFSHDSCDPKRSRCGANEVCTDRGQRGHYSCQCADNAFRYEDGTCRGIPLLFKIII